MEVKPGLLKPQLPVEWSVTFLYSIAVKRRCCPLKLTASSSVTTE